jgi:hypothetical protein
VFFGLGLDIYISSFSYPLPDDDDWLLRPAIQPTPAIPLLLFWCALLLPFLSSVFFPVGSHSSVIILYYGSEGSLDDRKARPTSHRDLALTSAGWSQSIVQLNLTISFALMQTCFPFHLVIASILSFFVHLFWCASRHISGG